MFKKILLFLLIVLVVIQFIHPKPNKSINDQPYYIANKYSVPDDVKSILHKACNDCHSNNTRYPWYSNIQPVDWWLTSHIHDGKRGLNFDEYTNKSLRYQYGKMKQTIDLVKKNAMPLNSYTWIHKDAILTDDEKGKLTSWAQGIVDSLSAKYPPDSLVRPKK